MANIRRKIRGSIPGEPVPLLEDRELIKDSDTGDVYIGHNGSNRLISGSGTLSSQVSALSEGKVNISDVSETADPGKIAKRDSNGVIHGNLLGSAAYAERLSVARTISLSGGATATGTFNGSADLLLQVSVDPDRHVHALSDLNGFPDLSTADGKILRVVDGALVTGNETTPTNVYTKSEVDAIAVGKAAATHNHGDLYFTETEVTNALAGKASSNHTHDDRYLTGEEVDARISGKSETGHTHAELAAADHDHDSEYSDAGHAHDGRYYTETEMDGKLLEKSDKTHDHDSNYYKKSEVQEMLDSVAYTEREIDLLLSDKAPNNHTHSGFATEAHNHDSEYSKTTHFHDDRYYTEQEVDIRIANLQPSLVEFVSEAATHAAMASVSETNAMASANTAADMAIEATNNGAAQVVLAANQAALSLSHAETSLGYSAIASASAATATNRASYAEGQAILAAEIKDFILTLQSAVGNIDGGNSLSVYTAQQVINGGDSNG